MFEASNLGISIIDQNLHYIATNPAFQAMLGYTESELHHLTPVDVTAEEDRDVTRMRINELEQGERHHYETVKQYRRKDGTRMWGHVYVSVVRNPQFGAKMFIGTLIDITATKTCTGCIASDAVETRAYHAADDDA